MPKLTIPDKLYPFYSTPKRFKIAIGGRGGAKSQTLGDIALMKVQTEGKKVGCFREFQASMDDSVYSLLLGEIDRMGLYGFSKTNTSISHLLGGAFKFKGLARGIDAVKSMYGFDIFWTEEAQFLSEESLNILTKTLRKEDKEDKGEYWFSLNPMSSADPVSKRFLEPYMKDLRSKGFYEDDLHYIVWINYNDNPWFPASLEEDRFFDYKNLPRNLYNHIWLGYYNDSVENSIILTEWFEAAVDAHKKLGFKPVGPKIIAHDPSDEGADDKAVAIRHGSVILDVEVLGTGDSNEGCDWATGKAISENVDLFVWDCDGLGSSLKRQVEQAFNGKKIDHKMFKGSEGPDRPEEMYLDSKNINDKAKQRSNKHTFKNKRAQYYWMLRDRFYSTYRAVKGEYIDPDALISLSSDILDLEQLRSELCRIPKKHNANGLIQILSKPEMKKLKIDSPNMADSIMMSLISPEIKTKIGNVVFDSLFS